MMGNELPILDDVLLDSFAMAPFPLSVATEDVSYTAAGSASDVLTPDASGKRSSSFMFKLLLPLSLSISGGSFAHSSGGGAVSSDPVSPPSCPPSSGTAEPSGVDGTVSCSYGGSTSSGELDIGTSSVPVVIFSTSGTCCNSSPAAGSLTLGECSAPSSDGWFIVDFYTFVFRYVANLFFPALLPTGINHVTDIFVAGLHWTADLLFVKSGFVLCSEQLWLRQFDRVDWLQFCTYGCFGQ